MDGRWESLRFPPAIAPPTRPALLLLLLRAAAAFWSMQRNTAPERGESSKNSLLQSPGAPLLPEGAMAKWVSPDLLQSPYAQWGPFFPMTPFEDGVSHEEEEGWLCRSTRQDDTKPFSASGTNSPCCCRQGWIMDGDPLAMAGTWEGQWAAEPGMEHHQGRCRVHLPMLGCFRRRQIRASRSSFW